MQKKIGIQQNLSYLWKALVIMTVESCKFRIFLLKRVKPPKRIQSFTKNLEIIKKIGKTSTCSETLQKVQEISGCLPKIWLNLIPDF